MRLLTLSQPLEKPTGSRFYRRARLFFFGQKTDEQSVFKGLSSLALTGALLLLPLSSQAANDGLANRYDKVLTLEQAISASLKTNPALASFTHRQTALRGKQLQTGLAEKPVWSLSVEDALGTGDLSGLSGMQTTLSISWLMDESLRSKRAGAVNVEMDTAKIARQVEALDIAADTAKLYLQALYYQESLLIKGQAIRFARDTIAEVNKRLNAGKANASELRRAEAMLIRHQLSADDISHELSNTKYLLAAQWGSQQADFDAVAGSLANLPELLPFESLKQTIKNNPQVRQLMSMSRQALTELEIAREMREPQWRISTGLRRKESSDDFGLVAGISVPFGGNNNYQGRIAEMNALAAERQAEADSTRFTLENELYIAYQEMEHFTELAGRLQSQLVPVLEQAQIDTRDAFERGKTSYLEWVSVQNELLQAFGDQLDASYQAQLNQIHIEHLTGARITDSFNK